MAKDDSLARLERAADRDRRALAADIEEVRAEADVWKGRVLRWTARAAGAAAAAGIAFGIVRRVRQSKTAAGRAKKVTRRVRNEMERYKPRPIPVTLLFVLLRTPAVRRALAAGAGRLIEKTRRLPDDVDRNAKSELPKNEPAKSDSPNQRTESHGTPRGESHAARLEGQAGEARQKEEANEKAPSKEEGEQKAKQALESFQHAPFKRKIHFIVDLFREAFKAFLRDEALTRAAALAYYTLLSLAPLLIIVIAVAGIAFGQENVRAQILGQIGQLVGQDAAKTIATMMQKASKPSKSIPAAVIGVATLLFGAGGVFGFLHDVMNKIWAVPEKKGGGIWTAIQSRFLSFAMVLGTGFLLLVSLVVSAGLSAVAAQFGDEMGLVFNIVHQIVSWAVIGLLFALIFRYLPDTRIAWRDVWIGAGITSLFFVVGQFLIGLYLGGSSVSSVYGGAGSLLIVLLWTYYSGTILFFGAEVTQTFANQWGSRRGKAKAAA